jgi:hypothetical protein
MDSTSTPLADYFWIAGVESISYNDTPQTTTAAAPAASVESTIVEDGEPESTNRDSLVNGNVKTATARHSRQGSANRLSKLSVDGRLSIHTLDDIDGNGRSNRSSATIRPSHNGANGNPNSNGGPGGAFGDFDFDAALFKFAAERENFLEDLSFSAGAKIQARPPMVNPRAERIRADEQDPASGRRSPLRSIKGSIRRKMSFRDMNSVRRQPQAGEFGRSLRMDHLSASQTPNLPPRRFSSYQVSNSLSA